MMYKNDTTEYSFAAYNNAYRPPEHSKSREDNPRECRREQEINKRQKADYVYACYDGKNAGFPCEERI